MIFVVGGAAMALAYHADRVTDDIDGTFAEHSLRGPWCSRIDRVIARWWRIAHLRLNPIPEEERAAAERAAAG